MKIENQVKIAATARNILLSLLDAAVISFYAPGRGGYRRRAINDYERWRSRDANRFSHNLYYLKKQKLIKSFVINKERYIELTPKGKKRARFYFIKKARIKRQNKWDGKWRVVIFDIREDKRTKRDCIRNWLKNLGIVALQKSVYTYPFDFKRELNLMIGALVLYQGVKYMICDIIEGEEELINHFFKEKILNEDDLKINSRDERGKLFD